MIPGEVIAMDGEIELNAGAAATTLTVANTGDRPIQVGSHYHFFETNPALSFDRAAARGMRLNIAAGTAVRFEPGQAREVQAGSAGRAAAGLWLPPARRDGRAVDMPARISRATYADIVRAPRWATGCAWPTTELFIEVEKDFTTYGEEVKFGGGKVIRDGMGQSQISRAGGAVDTVITNALIVDWWGIVKADVGLKDGRIAAIGKAGNPDAQSGVTIIIGPGTEVIAGESKILTAGAMDCHIHFICPQQIEEALTSGVTCLLGGGTGPATGTKATTATPGPWHLARMIEAAEGFPMNIGFSGKGNASLPEALVEQVAAEACCAETA